MILKKNGLLYLKILEIYGEVSQEEYAPKLPVNELKYTILKTKISRNSAAENYKIN